MQVWDDVLDVPDDWLVSVVTIGVFDGVHRGHRELIRTAIERAAALGMPCVALTFSPSPAEILTHGDPPARLATLQQRLRLLSELGLDATAVIQFDEVFAAMTASQFAGSVLSDQLHAGLVVVGENFRFGQRARGDVRMLDEFGQPLGFNVDPVHLLVDDGQGGPLSSTLIRGLIAQGEVAAAARCLARPHRVEGVVVRGDGRGRQLGLPTANVNPTPYAALPADGVYAGRIVLDPYGPTHAAVPAAISVGTNPTFDGVERRVEAFAYEAADLDLYDQHLAVDFVARIRDQERFADEAGLVRAVERDVDHARAVLGG